MWMNKVKLIVTDMDGTFLGHKGLLLEENGAAFRQAAEEGIHIAFASGRLTCVLSHIAHTLGLPDCHIIGLNGAHVLSRPYGETLALHPLSERNRQACLDILHREGCQYNLYTDEGLYTNRVLDDEAAQAFRQRFAACHTVALGLDAYRQAARHPCVKFFVRAGANAAGYERAKKAIASLPGIELTSAAPGTFEIMPSGIDKAGAVRHLAETLNISMAEVMAFGDYDNDVAMLSACSCSVAMANATVSARNAATYQTLSNVEGGVAYGVRQMLAGKLESLQKQDDMRG